MVLPWSDAVLLSLLCSAFYSAFALLLSAFMVCRLAACFIFALFCGCSVVCALYFAILSVFIAFIPRDFRFIHAPLIGFSLFPSGEISMVLALSCSLRYSFAACTVYLARSVTCFIVSMLEHDFVCVVARVLAILMTCFPISF